MVKVLRFGDDDISRDRLRFLHQGLCQSQKLSQPRDLDVLRREGMLRKKLEAISEPETPPPNRFQWMPRLLKAPAEIEVEQADLQMLRDYTVAMAWSAMVSDAVADAVEWAWGAPEKASLT